MGQKSSKPSEAAETRTNGRRPPARRQQNRPRAAVSDKDKAILELKAARDKVKRYQIRLENEVKAHRTEAKKFLHQNDKKKALFLLKISKFKEGQLEKSDAQLMNLLQMVETIEYEETQLQVVNGLDAANKVLKMIHEVMSPERVEEVMEDMREQSEMVQEINEILGSSLTHEDEEDILAELEEMEHAEQAQEHAAPEAMLDLPLAPSAPLQVANTANGPMRPPKTAAQKKKLVAAS